MSPICAAGPLRYPPVMTCRVLIALGGAVRDLGRRLLDRTETEAARRGCTAFNRIACDPPGTAPILMTKTL